jgi:hypothetical protein
LVRRWTILSTLIELLDAKDYPLFSKHSLFTILGGSKATLQPDEQALE